jgi:hypothetical protein
MDSATWESYTECLRVTKFVIETKNFGLKVQPKIENYLGWNQKSFCERDWTGDPDTRVSITDFIIYLLDILICWQSKSQKGLTLSSIEANYVSISESFKEVKFVYCLLCDLHIKVNLPILVRNENIGVIFMPENALTNLYNQHVDTHYHFV